MTLRFLLRRHRGDVHASAPGSIAAWKVVNSRTEIHHHHHRDTDALDGFGDLHVPVDSETSTVLHQLRQTVKAQLLEEVAAQELRDPPLRMTWNRYAGPALSLPGTPVVPEQGALQDMAREFSELPRKRLVVLGPAGAGKTTSAMLLMLEIVQDTALETQVPVLFSLSSWDIDRVPLRDWIAGALCSLYSVVTSADSGHSLIQRRHVIPVLDGLDELPRAAVPRAVTAINRAFTGTDPFILTCRTDALDAARTAGRTLISADAALELAPVELDAAMEFLAANTSEEHGQAWNRVAAEARGSVAHPVTSLCERPLTIWLAREAFRGAQIHPADFLDRGRFRDAADIEAFLVQALVPAALYRARRMTHGRRRRFRTFPSSDRTRHALAYLAVVMTNQGNRRFEWWRLPTYIGWRERKSMMSWLVAAPSVMLTALMMPFIVMYGYSADSVLYLLGFEAAVVGMRVMQARFRASLGTSVADAFSDFTWIPVAGIEYTPKPTPRILDRKVRASIRSERRRAFRGVRIPQSFYMIALGGLAFCTWQDLRAAWPFMVVVGGSEVLTNIPPTTTSGEGRKTSWGPYVMTRLWLACHGTLPFRLTLFLEKMQYAGLLRPVGAAYEFRNVELQKGLATAPGAQLARRVDLVSPLVLPGAALHTGEAKALVVKGISSNALRQRGLCDALADVAAIFSSATQCSTESARADIPGLIRQFNEVMPGISDHGPARRSVIEVFPREELPHRPEGRTAAELRRAELHHLNFDLDAADAGYAALIEKLGAQRGKYDISVARLELRSCLVAVDRCQEGDSRDLERAMLALLASADRLTRAAGADHAETLTATLVDMVLISWFMARVPDEPWRARDDGGGDQTGSLPSQV